MLGEHNCDVNADCVDIEGSFYCICIDGYAGSGTVCSSKCKAIKITYTILFTILITLRRKIKIQIIHVHV